MKTVVFFDLETGGLDSHKHPIIQIAAAAANWHSLDVIETFEEKIAVREADCDPEALQMNSYDPVIWARDAVPDHVALSMLSDFLRRHACVRMVSKLGNPYMVAQLAAYNASFDQEFLFRAYRELDMFLPAAFSVLCVLQRVRWHFAELGQRLESNKLTEVCRNYLGIELEHAHDAMGDCLGQIEVLKKLRKEAANAA